jgi:hypothetical protein
LSDFFVSQFASGRQILLKEPVDCGHRDQGLTLTVNLNGKERQINVSVEEIKEYAGVPNHNAAEKAVEDNKNDKFNGNPNADEKAQLHTKVVLSSIAEWMRAEIRGEVDNAAKEAAETIRPSAGRQGSRSIRRHHPRCEEMTAPQFLLSDSMWLPTVR